MSGGYVSMRIEEAKRLFRCTRLCMIPLIFIHPEDGTLVVITS